MRFLIYDSRRIDTGDAKSEEKDPEDRTTGEEPMTGPQRSYLETLCREAGEEFNEKLTKADASKTIKELQQKTGFCFRVYFFLLPRAINPSVDSIIERLSLA